MQYTPAPGEEGTTVFVVYTVCNTAVTPNVCENATVTITVDAANDTPVGMDDALTVTENSTTGTSNQIDVTTNDTIGTDGSDGEDYAIATGPTNGTVMLDERVNVGIMLDNAFSSSSWVMGDILEWQMSRL